MKFGDGYKTSLHCATKIYILYAVSKNYAHHIPLKALHAKMIHNANRTNPKILRYLSLELPDQGVLI